jgi:ketosteroid isomerase-like protein
MSQENVEIVRQVIDAYNAGDLDLMLSFHAPNVEAIPDASVFPEATPRHGREEYRAFLGEISTTWIKPEYGISELFMVDDGRVVHRGDWGGEGVSSGIELASTLTAIYTISEGNVSSVVFFFDHAEALEAVGLEG